MTVSRILMGPMLAAASLLGGLLCALWGEGAQDALACLLVAAPVAWCCWKAWPAATADASLHRSLAVALMAGATAILLVLALWRWRELGWGALVWLAAAIIGFAIRAPHARRNRKNRVTEDRNEEGWLVGLVFLGMMVLPLLHLAFGLFAFADYALPPAAMMAGAALQPVYLWLFWRSHADLGRNWSLALEVRAGHQLVTHGVYRRIRHPMYAGLWLSALAQPLLIQNAVAGLAAIPAFAVLYGLRLPREEAMMRETFGAAYDAYCRRAGRVLPRIRAKVP